MDQIKIKTGNTYPPIRRRIVSEETNETIDLTDWTVRFHLRDSVGDIFIDEVALVESPEATSGIVRYDWSEGDTDNSGHYYGEFEFTKNTGEIFTLPSGEEYLDVIIGDSIA